MAAGRGSESVCSWMSGNLLVASDGMGEDGRMRTSVELEALSFSRLN